ncbi:aspartate dehydrogenase [Frigidibacter sp. MR17.24]|uniref:aspartate dehydrogenase n=1 Tax=Frigidibacter sp. MR17.24 TaxID=3127345 RepID=UPI0030129D4A
MTAGIAVIGWGAMARSLHAALEGGTARAPAGPRITACLLRPGSPNRPPAGIAVVTDAAALAASAPALVVECAGHGAVRDHVPALLRAGLAVVLVSAGALTDDALRRDLAAAASAGGASLSVVAGAVGALDLLRAAALAGLDRVTYRGIKPPGAWRGSPAETLCDLGALDAAQVFFRGTAREAAARFPKNANVAAAIALAGTGFDATEVELVADPAASLNRHEIVASGAFGEMRFSVENRPLPDNPRTSHLAALSLEDAVRRHLAPACL